MEHIESPILEIPVRAHEVYGLLSDCMQHQIIMPTEVENYIADTDTCSYTIKGTGNLSLKIVERVSDASIKMLPNGKVPFPFEFIWTIESAGDTCKVYNKILAEMNPFIKAVAYKPLKNFITQQAENLQKYYSR